MLMSLAHLDTPARSPGLNRVRRLVVAVSSFAVLALYSAASAGQGTAAAAEALFQQGRDDMAAGNFESACPKFRQSDELDPALGTKLNLADCESKLGHLATAWELFKTVEQKLDPSDNRYPIAVQKRQAIEPQLPKLLITLAKGAPAATTVSEGTAVLGSTAFGVPLPLDPGRHELSITAPGRQQSKVVVLLEVGKTTAVEVAPGAADPLVVPSSGSLPAPSSATSPTTYDEAPTSNGTRTAGYVLGGLGVAGVVTAGIAGALTLSAKKTNQDGCHSATQTCDTLAAKDAASSGRTYGAITTAGIAVGVVGLGLGTYFLVQSGKSGKSRTALVTQAGPAGAQLSLVREW